MLRLDYTPFEWPCISFPLPGSGSGSFLLLLLATAFLGTVATGQGWLKDNSSMSIVYAFIVNGIFPTSYTICALKLGMYSLSPNKLNIAHQSCSAAY